MSTSTTCLINRLSALDTWLGVGGGAVLFTAMFFLAVLFVVCLSPHLPHAVSQTYVLDDGVGLGRQFYGIGGLSGGGVS